MEENKLFKLSASSVKTFESCPRKFFYSYIEPLPKKEWPHLLLGTFCHTVLEEFHNEFCKDKNKELRALMTESFSLAREKHTLTNQQLTEAKSLLQDYLFYVEENGMPNTLASELSFDFTLNNYFVRGFIDRLDIEKDGTFHIFDYKTTKKASYLDDFQLQVYAIAIHLKYPDIKNLKASYILLRNKSHRITYNIDLNDIEATKQKIIQYGDKITSEKKWEKKPSPLCKWCDFYDACFPKSDTKEDDWIYSD